MTMTFLLFGESLKQRSDFQTNEQTFFNYIFLLHRERYIATTSASTKQRILSGIHQDAATLVSVRGRILDVCLFDLRLLLL
jgi:hypothetical protein